MKKAVTVFTFIFISTFLLAQQGADTLKYRRSSMYTLMIDDNTRMHAEVIKGTFENYPVPEKFNNHNLPNRMISAKAGIPDQKPNIEMFLRGNAVARNLVAKWFNRDDMGAFNTELIAERGFYNASEMDANTAMQSKRGLAILADAGEELIHNTFVLVTDFKYQKLQEVMEKINRTANAVGSIAGRFGGLGNVASDVGKTANAVSENIEGYVVSATSYLYRIDWSDTVSASFYKFLWNDKLHPDPSRVSAFDSSDLFKLDYIGNETAWAIVPELKMSNKSEDTLIANATVQAIDAAIAKLQKKHEEFRTKTPLFSIDPLTAKIGTKEGVEPGDVYMVMERTMNDEGRTVYNKIGSIKAEKGKIWDNRYNITDAKQPADTIPVIDRTYFNKVSGKNFYPGVLIKQK